MRDAEMPMTAKEQQLINEALVAVRRIEHSCEARELHLTRKVAVSLGEMLEDRATIPPPKPRLAPVLKLVR